MMDRLKIGFVALCDSAALIVAHERGFFADEGLQVDLIREPSWANIRDKVAYGVLDAAHMLAPMLIETTIGAGNLRMPLATAFALNAGGGRIVSADGAPGERARYAMVYPYSSHHYALRHYLAEHHLDAELVVVPPAQMIAALSGRRIQGFCVGAPWGLLALKLDLGLAIASEPLPLRMEKVLGVRSDWLADHADAHARLVRAVSEASRWLQRAENHGEVAEVLARPEYLNAPPDVIAAGLGEIDFAANRPSIDDARWYLDRMIDYGQAVPDISATTNLAEIFRVDMFDEIIF